MVLLFASLLNVQAVADNSDQFDSDSALQEDMQAGATGLLSSQQKLSIGGLHTNSENGLPEQLANRLTIEDENSQGLQIDRLTNSTEHEVGILNVGRDWTSIDEYLPELEQAVLDKSNRRIENEIHWLTANGFSIALESATSSGLGAPDRLKPNHGSVDSSTRVVLSWQPDQNGNPGDYRISAIGTRLNLNRGQSGFDGDSVAGWGLNLQGNWEIGDLVAALSVTYGQGIDSYILRRDRGDLYVTAEKKEEPASSYSIQPSLYYALSDKSKFHVVLGRHQGRNYESDPSIQENTLDTLHLEYTWSPWPKTEFGLTLSHEDEFDATSGEKNSMILIEGSRRF